MFFFVIMLLTFFYVAMPENKRGFGYLRKQIAHQETKLEPFYLALRKTKPDDFVHYEIIRSKIVEKIQDLLVFPKNRLRGIEFDKESSIKYIITRVAIDDSDACIESNIVLPNLNSNTSFIYMAEFFAYVFLGSKKVLAPIECDSNYLPRFFYETIDNSGVIGLQEMFH